MTTSDQQRDSDFSSLSGWQQHISQPHSLQLIADPLDNNNQVLRVELRADETVTTRSGDFYRAEIYEGYKAPFDQDMHYRFNVMIPDAWQYDDVRAIIAQWHGTPDRHLGELSRSPNLGIELRNNRWLIRTQTSPLAVNHHNKEGMVRKQHYLSQPIVKNRWYQFDIRVKWTPSDQGYLQIKIDDLTVVDHHGPTSYYDCLGPYFKAGIYRDNTPNTFVIYFDQFSRKQY